MYSLQEGSFLVKLARQAVSKYLLDGMQMKPSEPVDPKFLEKSGVFVTIEKMLGKERSLRGCIGYPLPLMPLINATIDSAISAAINDPRFPPISKKELEEVVFEVSILTPPVQLHGKNPQDYPKLIKVGRDGLIIEKGFYKGLLLPQVPVEWGWDEETFISECCMKAGLPPDTWLSKNVKVFTFTAEVFMEETPNGAVVPKSIF